MTAAVANSRPFVAAKASSTMKNKSIATFVQTKSKGKGKPKASPPAILSNNRHVRIVATVPTEHLLLPTPTYSITTKVSAVTRLIPLLTEILNVALPPSSSYCKMATSVKGALGKKLLTGSASDFIFLSTRTRVL